MPQAAAQSATVVKTGASAAAQSANESAQTARASKARVKDPKGIWAEDEVASEHDVVAAAKDDRKRPEFDYAYKQRVGSEDVFLGLSGTTPSSIHCDTMVMRIALPGERLADIDLDVTADRITVAASKHKLATYLPVKVKHREAKAQWDAAKSALVITFPLDKSDSLLGGVM